MSKIPEENQFTNLSLLIALFFLAGKECGGKLMGNYGSFTSPNYPHIYPGNARCTWHIHGGHNQRIRLNFTELQ